MFDFDVDQYWTDRGRHYIREARLQDEYFIKEATYIGQIVAALQPRTILELGCGYGRITSTLATLLPFSEIVGLDLSHDQIREAKTYCPLRNVAFRQANLVEALPDGPFDLVIGIEVFLHLPPELLTDLIPRIFKVTDILLHDFDREHPRLPLSPHVWAHDYPTIYNALGLKHEVMESGPYSLIRVTRD